MSFKQTGFEQGASGGFASTVWDSAIVLAKYVEKHQEKFRGLRVCELGAGCGLVSAALVHAGASRVVATDLRENLDLLRENLEKNCGGGGGGGGGGDAWDTKELMWGHDAATALGETFDLVVATDCMYIAEAVPDLVSTLVALVGTNKTRTEQQQQQRKKVVEAREGAGVPGVLFSYGRNRQAEEDFIRECDAVVSARGVKVTMTDVAEDELDELYQCSDVRVITLDVVAAGGGGGGGRGGGGVGGGAVVDSGDGATTAGEEGDGGGGNVVAPSAAPADNAKAICHVQLNRNKGFKCGFCEDNKVLKNKTGLKRHVTAMHADDPRSEVFNIATESGEEVQ